MTAVAGRGDNAPRPRLIPRYMRFMLYLSMLLWVALAVVSTVDIGATARLFATIHLG